MIKLHRPGATPNICYIVIRSVMQRKKILYKSAYYTNLLSMAVFSSELCLAHAPIHAYTGWFINECNIHRHYLLRPFALAISLYLINSYWGSSSLHLDRARSKNELQPQESLWFLEILAGIGYTALIYVMVTELRISGFWPLNSFNIVKGGLCHLIQLWVYFFTHPYISHPPYDKHGKTQKPGCSLSRSEPNNPAKIPKPINCKPETGTDLLSLQVYLRRNYE